jgi:hypothetical protein
MPMRRTTVRLPGNQGPRYPDQPGVTRPDS